MPRKVMSTAVTDKSTVQGWSSVIPKFSAVDFISFYIEIPVMIVMFSCWLILKRFTRPVGRLLAEDDESRSHDWRNLDLVDIDAVDLTQDEYMDEAEDKMEDEERESRIRGPRGLWWRLYYWIV